MSASHCDHPPPYHLGAMLGPSWPILGASWGAQDGQKEGQEGQGAEGRARRNTKCIRELGAKPEGRPEGPGKMPGGGATPPTPQTI